MQHAPFGRITATNKVLGNVTGSKLFMLPVQLRMVLEDSHAALEDARGGGVPIAAGSETGVYVACISFEYATVLERGGFKVASMMFHTPPCPAASPGGCCCAAAHGSLPCMSG